jgi:predicted dehydrogenase
MIGVAVVGAGLLGARHARVWQEMGETRLLRVVDVDRDRAGEVASRYGAVASSLEEVLVDPAIAAASVATPDHLHAAPVLALLRAGKDVLVEKPLATGPSEARAMVEAAVQRGRILQVNFSQRFLPEYAEIARLVHGGAIGRPTAVMSIKRDTRFVPERMISWAAQTSPVWFMTSHDLDLVRWYLGTEPVWVVARERRGGAAATPHDGLHALVGFGGGVEASFSTFWSYPDTYPSVSEDRLELIGSEGMLRYDSRGRRLELYTRGEARETSFSGAATATEVEGRLQGAFATSLRAFLEAVRTRRPPATPAADSIGLVACQAAMLASARDGGRPVELPTTHDHGGRA